MSLEEFRKTEMQANYFVALAKKDDIEMIQEGHGRFVDSWLTEKLCIDALAVIYGFKEKM